MTNIPTTDDVGRVVFDDSTSAALTVTAIEDGTVDITSGPVTDEATDDDADVLPIMIATLTAAQALHVGDKLLCAGRRAALAAEHNGG